ncbi:SipW-dependent-type signal peptide-containing protein [Aeromicrobium duanguangcaii]|uniref:CalY family protein n=1 Tax=Aeromicrobium duanguangcaii TaxID=2968086 RepID=A0ABY5KH63_9ACTN|nr:SipW-dependent-type signal peptide-containing protein [Aeromicrobium duanguangcaii]MCD9153086.1 CalY family protein [Aeromicrobium duanguangcaii]MCL3836919.1 CalY family protein [Aeromicrobium duanguangcaii]UUI69812.1 CalY family protein [Aeromicrobium duanguangcaii]
MPETTTVGRARLHTAWTWISSVQVRLLMALGLVLGFSAVGTAAYWSDSATLAGEIESGSLDLQLGARNPETGEVQWSAVGLNQNWNYSVQELDNVAPGESVAKELHIRNAGTTPLTFTAAGSSSTDALNPHLTATMRLGGEASNTGTREEVNRIGTCTAGTATWWDGHVLSTTPEPLTPGNAPVTLAPNASIQVCMVAGLSADAPNEYQDKSTMLKIDFDAKQVGAP